MNIEKKIEDLENIILYMKNLNSQELIEHSLEIDNSIYQQIQDLKTQGSKTICSKKIQTNELVFQCYDCSDMPNHIYCRECFQIEKHKNHLAVYKYSIEESCDCGDESQVKKESFCDEHQLNLVSEIDENIGIRYRQFFQISFALLFNKIEQVVDYPLQFKERIHNLILFIYEPELFDLIEQHSDKLTKSEQLIGDIQKLSSLIVQVLQTMTLGNISLSVLTSKYLLQPIDQDILQEIIQTSDCFLVYLISNQIASYSYKQ